MTDSHLPTSPADRMAALLPGDVAWQVGRIADLDQPPHPAEAAAVARAVPKRQREFAAGRQCARVALQRLGEFAIPVVASPDRAPVWPPGVVGSITHNDVFAAAAVSRSTQFMGLGIDVDTVSRFDESLTDALCTPVEIRRWLAGRDAAVRRQQLATLFSVKEAFYKAQYPVSRAWLGFHDVEICRWERLEDGRSHLEIAVINTPQPRPGADFNAASISLLMDRRWDAHSVGDAEHVWASVLMRSR